MPPFQARELKARGRSLPGEPTKNRKLLTEIGGGPRNPYIDRKLTLATVASLRHDENSWLNRGRSMMLTFSARYQNQKTWILLLVLAAIGLNSFVSTVRAQKQVLPPSTQIEGVSRLEHSQQWWETMVNIPAENNPLLDETGENALLGQVGSILYLPGSFAPSSNRAATVEQGTTRGEWQ